MPAARPSAAVRPARYRYRLGGATVEVVLHEPAPDQRAVPEALVHDLWQTQRFDHAGLATSGGRPVTVLDPGRPNADAGPDFLAARLRIGELAWGGDVEIHTTSSDWFAHGHHRDARYNATVLHVTLHADVWTGGLLREDGTLVPELVLYPRLERPLRALLYDFYTRPPEGGVLCASRWAEAPEALRRSWIRRLARERLSEKTARLAEAYLAAPDLEALLHERLFAGLGYAQNAAPMADLARRLPLALVRTLEDPADLEALHLGTAGLLPAPSDLLESDRASADYAMDLRERFARLRAAHGVAPMEKTSWQFFRLRPANFPPLRIAQAAALTAPGGLLRRDPLGTLLHALAAEEPVAALRKTLRARPSAFWDEHVRLEKKTQPRDPTIGRPRADTLLANAALPLLLLHAQQSEHPGLAEAVPAVLEELPAGRGDQVTRRFAKLGTKPRSALEAQGLHQLYRMRCREARCLQCAIGRFLLDEA